jgi:hypothetical protein
LLFGPAARAGMERFRIAPRERIVVERRSSWRGIDIDLPSMQWQSVFTDFAT